jgi:fructose-bisphosphate aldolase class I
MQGQDTLWALTYSFGRALVDPSLAAWAGRPATAGRPENRDAGQQALMERVRANAAVPR